MSTLKSFDHTVCLLMDWLNCMHVYWWIACPVLEGVHGKKLLVMSDLLLDSPSKVTQALFPCTSSFVFFNIFCLGAAWPSSCKASDLRLKKGPTRPPHQSDHKETFSGQLAVAVLCEEDAIYNKQQAPVSSSCLPWNLSPLERNLKSEDSSVNCNQG